MKIKSGFVLEEVGGSYIAVAVGKRAEEFRVLIRLNSSGAFLWRAIENNDLSEAALADLLVDTYGIDHSLAERDVQTFTAKLTEAGLLDA